MAIGSIIVVLLSQILLSGLNGASAFGKRINRDNDIAFAMNSMIDELLAADEIYQIQDRAVQFYVREKGEGGHKIVSYLLKDGTLSRYADHDHFKYDKEKVKLTKGTRTVILDGVDDLQFTREGNCLRICMKRGKESERVVALRGRYD